MSLNQEDIREHRVKVLIQEPKALAKQRLMDFVAQLPVAEEGDWDEQNNYVITHRGEPTTYRELIERATAYQTDGKYWSEGPRFDGTHLYTSFWDDYALVTQLPVKDTYGFFSCAC